MPLCSPGWCMQAEYILSRTYFHSWDCFLSTGAEIVFFRSQNYLSIPGRNNQGKCIFNKSFNSPVNQNQLNTGKNAVSVTTSFLWCLPAAEDELNCGTRHGLRETGIIHTHQSEARRAGTAGTPI